jgi:hypothetical protein
MDDAHNATASRAASRVFSTTTRVKSSVVAMVASLCAFLPCQTLHPAMRRPHLKAMRGNIDVTSALVYAP